MNLIQIDVSALLEKIEKGLSLSTEEYAVAQSLGLEKKFWIGSAFRFNGIERAIELLKRARESW